MSSSRRKNEVDQVDWVQLAVSHTEKLIKALEQLLKNSQGQSVCATTEIDLETLVKRRLVTVGQLETLVESFSVPDLVNIPAESQITNIVLAEELSQEQKELGSLKANLSSDIENLENLLTNRNQRDENLVKIIQGLRLETEAIEDEDDEAELIQLRRMKHEIRGVLNTILDEAYPEMKNDVKKIIEALYEVKDEEDPYIHVPEDVDVQAIQLLQIANIIAFHETDTNLIKMMF